MFDYSPYPFAQVYTRTFFVSLNVWIAFANIFSSIDKHLYHLSFTLPYKKAHLISVSLIFILFFVRMAIHNFFPSNTFKFLLIVIFINILSTDLAITEDYLEEPKVRKVATPSHFVLVHGACFGGWSWYKIRSLLESVGHKVSSPDLISAGIQPSDPNSLHHFQEYNKPIHDILANLPQGEKVSLLFFLSIAINV